MGVLQQREPETVTYTCIPSMLAQTSVVAKIYDNYNKLLIIHLM